MHIITIKRNEVIYAPQLHALSPDFEFIALDSLISKAISSGPLLITDAIVFAMSIESIPVIVACPFAISSETVGEEISLSPR